MPFPSRHGIAGERPASEDARIAEKIAALPQKPREGLARVNADLRAAGVAPATRLHLVSAVLDLGRLAEATRAARMGRAVPSHARPSERDFLDDFRD